MEKFKDKSQISSKLEWENFQLFISSPPPNS